MESIHNLLYFLGGMWLGAFVLAVCCEEEAQGWWYRMNHQGLTFPSGCVIMEGVKQSQRDLQIGGCETQTKETHLNAR